MKSLKQSTILFLGMSLMLMCTYLNTTILRYLSDFLIIDTAGVEAIAPLKKLIMRWTLIVGFLMALLSWGGKVGRVFKTYFPVNILIIGVFTWLLYTNSPLISNPAVVGGFYVWAKISMVLSVVLVWGYANQKYTFEAAAIQYPILSVLFWNIAPSGLLPIIIFISRANNENTYPIMLGIVGALSVLTFSVYLWMSRTDLGVKEKGINVTWGYWAALAVIVFAVKFAAYFPAVAFKEQIRMIFKDASLYSAFMPEWSFVNGGLSFLAGLAAVPLGVILYFRGPKALVKVISIVGVVMLIGGVSIFFTSQEMLISKETIMISMMGYALFLSLSGVFKLLKELVFFGVDHKSRFTAKIAIDVIGYAIAPSASAYVVLNTMQFGPLNEHMNLLAGIFLIAMVVCFAALYRVNRDLKYGLPSPKKTLIKE